MNLPSAFTAYITKEQLFSPGDRLLLAVSGGLDSVVLCDLAHRAGLHFVIAHCNFQLRGAESDRDETFVRQLGERYGREVLVRRCETEAYAAEQGRSIQTAARELRYEWFRQITGGWGRGAVIVTAHHLDDNIETLVMNFFKGTGMTGLRGMLPRQDGIVRPLLFARRAALEQFATESGLQWVEDSSNQSDAYTRNFFRHRVLPLVQQVYPAASDNLADNLVRFREIGTIYRQAIEQHKQKLLEYKGAEIHIPVLKLQKAGPLPTLIYEIFTSYGFTPRQTTAIAQLLEAPSGKYVCSPTHRVLRNRQWLILTPLPDSTAAHVLIESGRTEIQYAQGILRLEEGPAPEGPPPSAASAAWLDAGEIVFPLLLRPWRPGDYFYPLGMRKKKKLARFFINEKLSLAEKEKVWVLETDKKIVWVVGRRIDDRFRITGSTTKILRISTEGKDNDYDSNRG